MKHEATETIMENFWLFLKIDDLYLFIFACAVYSFTITAFSLCDNNNDNSKFADIAERYKILKHLVISIWLFSHKLIATIVIYNALSYKY